jgi:D-alanyl-D-alanine carboxypeptidase/D-alanyl-D-alanine-endopeptidase (penicillin-binding protein 4)
MNGRTRAFVAALLAVGAVVASFAAFRGDPSVASISSGRVTTPLWSARRAPQAVVDAVGDQHLQRALDQSFSGNGVCFLVQSGGQVLATHNPTVPLIGASTQKLLVAAAALGTMTPDFTYETKVVTTSAPSDGSVDKLYLVGSGDPVLATAPYAAFIQAKDKTRGDVTTSLDALADAIAAKGVQRVPGGIVVDDSRYDAQRYNPSWKDSYRTDGDISTLGALTVNDGWSAWDPRKIAVDDPAVATGAQLAALLKARGVQVGNVTRGTAPGDAPALASVKSPPLKDIVTSMLRSSDNLTAELLVKELGARASKQGTTAAGGAAVLAELKQLGVPVDGVVLSDGSGLSRDNRDTCATLAAVLALRNRPGFEPLLSGLPVSGQSGTLVDQFLGTPLQGMVAAKTGSLDGVSGFAGLVSLNRSVEFAFLDNGNFTEAAGAPLRVKMATIVGTYPDAPAADALVPGPTPPAPAAVVGDPSTATTGASIAAR